MLRKILIAVDGSMHSRNALAYVADLFRRTAEVQFTIFNVQPIVSQYLLDEARIDPKAYSDLQRLINRQTAESNEMLESARGRFIRMGIKPDRIDVVSQVRMQGQAKDIIDYAHKHLYDAIVAGRRGLSRVQKAFMGSTSAKVMAHAAAIPVWIVDGEVRANNILAAVDASSAALQMVDYLAFMLAGHPEVRLTFYHVDEMPAGISYASDSSEEVLAAMVSQGEDNWQERFWQEAGKRLKAAGMAENRIEQLRAPRTGRIAKMILEQVQAGNFDTVVLGRRGAGNAFFLGSVSHYVSEHLVDRAVWLVG